MRSEGNRRSIQDFLDAQKTSQERNLLGQFSTPYPLALDIMRFAKANIATENLSFLEPAVGTGVFYSAFLEVFGNLEHKALGFEIDPYYFTPAKEFWQNSALEIRCADFLQQKPDDSAFSLLVANPPYCRHHHIDCDKKKQLQEMVLQHTGIRISGLAGLYCYFLLLSTRWLARNALSCWLIPGEFMDVNYGQAIKKYLLEKVDLIQIHRFLPEDLQFSDALVTSSIVIFRNCEPSGRDIIFSQGRGISIPAHKEMISPFSLNSKMKWTALFTENDKSEETVTIGDFFKVKRGLATGDNQFFIVNQKTIDEYQIPRPFLTPILPSPRYVEGDRIDSIGGIPKLKQRLFLFSCELPENEIRELYPALWNYIQRGEEKGVRAGYICSRRVPWYSCEKRTPATFVMPYMGRSQTRRKMFRFILNNSTAMATNVYLLLYPKPQYESRLYEHDTLMQVWRELNAIPTESLIRNGRVYGGGLYKIEPKELMSTPAAGLAKVLGMGQPIFRQAEFF